MRYHGAFMLFGFIMFGAAFADATGANDFQSSSPENLTPGVAQPIPANTMASTNTEDVRISSLIWGGAGLLT